MHKLTDSGITVTDQFCGAGGNSIGAKRAGLIVLEAQNHWKRAIETYSANHQNTRVHHADVSNTDPRKLVSTDMLITSPECTTHSPAGGNRPRELSQRDMFAPDVDDPKFERSRATMQDVIRYAEYHRYRCIIVENVVEVTRWELFPWWLNGMQLLGYEFRIVNFNSMFAWPTPQSRDRVYLCFWRKGNRAPDLDITPLAHCDRCETSVNSVQTWKRKTLERATATYGQPIGKYRAQYVYTCPSCTSVVEPFYYAALNALDLSVTGERIGDKKRPLQPRTRERIEYGARKYAYRPLLISSMDGDRLNSRVRDAAARPGFTQSSALQQGVASPPFLIRMRGGDDHNTSATSTLDNELPTLVATGKSAALVTPQAVAMLINTRNGSFRSGRVLDASSEPMTTQTCGNDHAIATNVPPLLVETRHGSDGPHARVSDATRDAMATRSTKTGEGVLLDPAFITTAGSNETAPRDIMREPTPTHTTTERLALVLGPAFVAALRNHNNPEGLDGVLRSITAGNGSGAQFLVHGSAIISLRDTQGGYHVGALDEELRTLSTVPGQQAMISVDRAPVVVDYFGPPQHVGETLPTQTTHAARGIAEHGQTPDVDDFYFRMLLDREVGKGMAFPDDYVVTGNTGERVRQYGNAVTPPVMDMLSRRMAATLAPELGE
jgi:DNA (cytosine-5)-methyltransferase 1